MLRTILIAAALVSGTVQAFSADIGSDPQAEFKAFRDYFTGRFPKVPLADYVNGLD
jgi:sulfur-oxidizing protein SoxA